MKKIECSSIVLLIYLLCSNHALAIEEKIYDLNGNDTSETIIAKIGNPKNAKIEVKSSPEKIVNIDFNPPNEFTVSYKDLFEKVEVSKQHDMLNSSLVIADPKTGRIFHLTPQLKVSSLDVMKPWKSKQKLKPLKDILTEMNTHAIQLRPKKKVEVKK